MSIYEQDLGRCPANHVPLSPLSLLRRTAAVYPHKTATVYGEQQRTWGELAGRVAAFADQLTQLGIRRDDTVAVLAPNTPAALEMAFAVPAAGAVLNMINTRLDPAAIAFILDHGETAVFLVDAEFVDTAQAALASASVKPLVITIADPVAPAARIGDLDYDTLIARGNADAPLQLPDDEWQAIALNYTSGTTGNPKGVVTHHRGAYLNALGNGLEWNLPKHPVYLWTLPMFHCNGWCFPWTLAAYAGVNVCIRTVDAPLILDNLDRWRVSHLSGAPIVLNMLTTEAERRGTALPHTVKMTTAGAAPPAAVLARAAAIGMDVTHVYGLTEVYGPAAICAWHDEWDALPEAERATRRARQGVNYAVLEELSVRDPDTLAPVPRDGTTIGEIMFRGNVVMKGYLKNPAATQAAFAGGHFHSGDLAVWHEDGYVEIRDRSKDIIISGGENISSIEVEGTLYRHPAVGTAAVVAAPHERWGETPVAFVELAAGRHATEAEIIAHCRAGLAHFKCPTRVIFGDIPKTSTGKIQKFELRRRLTEKAN
ncbi:MAG: AMP-binding protein [Pseudomonadales bacterium]|nr:AMP-binding protein [Pseudomonadales bacterium]